MTVLTVPPHIYEKARHIAEKTAQPVEAVLLEHIESALDNCA